MCECGCSMGGPDYKMRGPNGMWYGIRVYTGCRDCDAPVGIDIFAIKDQDNDFYDIKGMPELEFVDGMASIPVLHAQKLVESMKQEGMDFDSDAWDIGDMSDAMRSASSNTVREWEKIVAPKKKRKRRKPRQQRSEETR